VTDLEISALRTACWFHYRTSLESKWTPLHYLFSIITQYNADAHKARTLTSMNARTQTLPLWASLKTGSANPWDWWSQYKRPMSTVTSPTTESISPLNIWKFGSQT
jgi:hypothetical protein